MKGSQKIILALASVAALVSGATSANADSGHGNGNGWGHGRGRNDTYIYRNYDHQESSRTNYYYQPNVGRPAVVRIYDNDRVILSRYVEDRYHNQYNDWNRHHHGYPSYRAPQRRYIVGYPLPDQVVFYSVPYDIRSRLRPTPIGYEYVRVDDDVLLMNQATKMIVDAVSILASAR